MSPLKTEDLLKYKNPVCKICPVCGGYIPMPGGVIEIKELNEKFKLCDGGDKCTNLILV